MVDNPTPAVEVAQTDEARRLIEKLAAADIDVSGTAAIGITSADIIAANDWLSFSPSRGGEVEKLREAAKAIGEVLNREGMPAGGWAALMMEAARAASSALASPPPVDADTPAASEGAVSAGFVLVPVEPTEAMRLEMAAAETRAEIWPAMLAASPKPASDTGARVEAGEGWQPIETVDRVNGRRLILAWDDCPTLPYHWEVGRWSSTLGWVNTYGKAFGASEPTHWMEPSAPSTSPATATGGVRDHAGSVGEGGNV